MGSVTLTIGEGTAKFNKRATRCSLNLLMLFSVLTTNLFALYAFTLSSQHHKTTTTNTKNNIDQLTQITRDITISQKQLTQIEKDLFGYESFDLSRPNIPKELQLFLTPHKLPLGKDSTTGITEMETSVGHLCDKVFDFLATYMTYKPFMACPANNFGVVQRLIRFGCEPLPRRRCFSRSVSKLGHDSFSEKASNLSHIGCSSDFDCSSRLKAYFSVDEVLRLGNGGIRIAFDVGNDGSISFAVNMAAKNVTVVTNTLNIDKSFYEFLALRRVFPLFLSLDHRLPFYDNVFDLVHASSGLENSGKPEKLEFLMFDVDRILRPGGFIWLDNINCVSDDKKVVLTRLIESFDYTKIKWVVGEKEGKSGSSKPEVYLSALLQKPVRA